MKKKCGFLIHNEYRQNDRQPDYWGVIQIGGSEYNIGGWRTKTKAGRPKIDLRVSLKSRQDINALIDAEEVKPMDE